MHWPCRCEAVLTCSLTEKCNLSELSLTNWATLEAATATSGTCDSSSMAVAEHCFLGFQVVRFRKLCLQSESDLLCIF